jgi:hypothetical protein
MEKVELESLKKLFSLNSFKKEGGKYIVESLLNKTEVVVEFKKTQKNVKAFIEIKSDKFPNKEFVLNKKEFKEVEKLLT